MENSCEVGFVKSGIFRSARFEKTKPLGSWNLHRGDGFYPFGPVRGKLLCEESSHRGNEF
jgi:hypothetical protein